MIFSEVSSTWGATLVFKPSVSPARLSVRVITNQISVSILLGSPSVSHVTNYFIA